MRRALLSAALLAGVACAASCQESARRDADLAVPETLLLEPVPGDPQVTRLPETGSPEAGLEPMQIRLDHSIGVSPPPRAAPAPAVPRANSPQPDRNRGDGGNNRGNNNRNNGRDRDRWRRWARR